MLLQVILLSNYNNIIDKNYNNIMDKKIKFYGDLIGFFIEVLEGSLDELDYFLYEILLYSYNNIIKN